MMDIVERLRQWAKFGYGVSASADMNQAADEIERLRDALEKIAAIDEIAVTDFDRKRHLWNFQKIARSALQQKESD